MPTPGSELILLLRLLRYRAWPWLPAYAKDRRSKGDLAPPTDLLVCMADHYEPPRSAGAGAHLLVAEWVEAYHDACRGIRDADGRLPQHTWFYRFDFLDEPCVRELAKGCWNGLGEIEFHLHHGHDTAASFRQKIKEGLALARRYGAMLDAGARERFAYIAGNWALNNGAGDDALSGCMEEIAILRSLGCHADFTYPALGSKAQPRRVNELRAATMQPGKAGYENGPVLKVGAPIDPDGFLMMDGPLYLDRSAGTIEYASFEHFTPFHPRRLDAWVNAGIGVVGRPEWRFVKLHTHGMQSRSSFRAPAVSELYESLLEYGARHSMRIHFVTAREMANVAHAAAEGESGDAGKYRDHRMLPPPNLRLRHDGPFTVEEYERNHMVVANPEGNSQVAIRDHGREIVVSATGLERLALRRLDGATLELQGVGEAVVTWGNASRQAVMMEPGKPVMLVPPEEHYRSDLRMQEAG